MKKQITIVLTALMVLGLFACGGKKEKNPGKNRTALSSGAKAANGKTLNDLMDHFKAAGIPVSEVKKRLFERAGAADGFAMIINDKPVEIYLHQDSDDEQIKVLEDYRANGITLSEDWVIHPIIRGEFVLFPAELNPHWEEIQAAFSSFPVD